MKKQPQVLKSNRIFLRPINKRDEADFKKISGIKQMNIILDRKKAILEKEEFKNIFNSFLASHDAVKRNLILAIVHRSGKQLLGFCGLFLHKNEKDIGNVYYALLSQYWGNGYAIEAMKTLFKYAFIKLELQKIVAYIQPENTRAWKVAERSGMKYMGQIIHQKHKFMLFNFTKRDFKAKIYY
jgi:[ribosomal protein S5]-alanine N-acetyltransferase